MTEKRCTKCGEVKSLDEFHTYPSWDNKPYSHCKSCESIRAKKWRETNKGKHAASNAKHYAEHKEQYAARSRKNQQQARIDCINHYGGKCACCGETVIEFLAIDHIHNDGAKQRRELGLTGGWRFCYWLRENGYPEGYQVLCHNCNSAYGFYGYCPHHGDQPVREVARHGRFGYA